MQIPKIDISGIEDKGFSRPLLQEFFSAYNKYGFGYIINHGIEKTLIEQLFQVSKQFHSQPLSEKMRVALDHNHRGYIAINTSTDVNSKLADVKKPNQRSFGEIYVQHDKTWQKFNEAGTPILRRKRFKCNAIIRYANYLVKTATLSTNF